ncbi:SDR family NAD(P)-dependent oxidoreductase [Geminicoccus harenae]|uniref:SDR family NAD(P)-dependent oxidoreductase n=1 Tax=Geminicoccus harenae TaxID=2498453 RepID=UPI00168A6B9F|nr:SDR family oxidoreductase [Geminicoccus harenae]
MSMLNEKVVIITGGGSGIGRETALRFTALGAKVVITGRRAAALAATAAGHSDIVGLVADAADPDDAGRAVSEAIDRWGRLDVLVNNAGAGAILPLAAAAAAAAAEIARILAVNVLGPSLLAAAALPHLAAVRGSIVNISSTFGHRPAVNLSHYAASKAALEHLTRCWALELAPQGIRVNAVAPGPTESEALTGMMNLPTTQAAAVREQERQRIPLGRRGEAGDIAAWIVRLADPSSDWITGQVIAVDGGLGLT